MSKKKTKIVSLILTLALLLTACFVLTACGESFSQKKLSGGEAGAKVESNGGYVVKQGNWLYFINGKITAPTDDIKYNYFGKNTKSGIARVKLDAEGNPDLTLDGDGEVDYAASYQIVVPKHIYTSSTDGGFSIFGEWIYYATPSTRTDNNSQLSSGLIDYYRTKIDGSSTQLVARITGASLQYKYTPTGLIWFADNTIFSVPYDNKSVKSQITIAEDVTSVIMPVSENYDPSATGIRTEDLVFYTVSNKDENGEITIPGNELFAASADKSVDKTIISRNDYLADGETVEENRDKLANLALKSYLLTDDGIELYYEKSFYVVNATVAKGLHGMLIKDDFSYDFSKEKQYTREAPSGTLIPMGLEKGIIIGAVWEKPKTANVQEDELYRDEDMYKGLSSTILLRTTENNIEYMYYQSGSKIMKAPLSLVANAKDVTSSNIDTSFFKLDMVGNFVYYISTDKLDYLVRADITNPVFDEDGEIEEYLVALMTKDDKEVWDERLENENK